MPDDTKTFTFDEDGVSFIVTVNRDGTATVEVTEGSADFNAIYWDDGDGGDFGLGGPLNMNGGGSRDENGDAIGWNDGVPLSMPGLGNDGPRQFDGVFDEDGNKTTYLEEGETLEIELDWGEGFDFDDLINIGIRATSVGDDGGSIKAVSSPDEPEEPEVPDDPEVVSQKLVYFVRKDDYDPDEDGSPYQAYLISKEDFTDFTDNDLDAVRAAFEEDLDLEDGDIVGIAYVDGTGEGEEFSIEYESFEDDVALEDLAESWGEGFVGHWKWDPDYDNSHSGMPVASVSADELDDETGNEDEEDPADLELA